MERGGIGFHCYRKHAKQPAPTGSGTDLVLQASNSSNSNLISSNVSNIIAAGNAGDNNILNGMQVPLQPQGNQCVVREQDQYMPIANVIRIMRRILPAHAKISDDAKETIQECVSEYISFITGEANDRCQREQRKTITAEDVLWAMGKLGFDDYVEPLTMFLNRYRETENERSTLREPILKRGAADYGGLPVPPYMPSFPMGDPQGMLDAAAMIGGYYRDASAAGNGGGGSGDSNPQNPLANYDPYSQFK